MKARYLFLLVLTGFTLYSSAPAQEASAQVSAPVAANPTQGAAASNGTAHEGKLRTASAIEIQKMRDAGLEPAVIRAYIQTLREPYKVTAEDVLYLHDHKVPDDLITDWMKKSGTLATPSAPAPSGPYPARSPDLVASATPNPLPVQVQQEQPQQAQQPQPQTVYQTTASPTVVYTSPSYVYSYDPYWYTPSLSFGLSWGYPYYG